MKGYIKNKTAGWRHAMKRSVGPNAKITLDELFEQYGEKHDLKSGTQFVEWLRDVKLTDKGSWDIVYEDGTTTVKIEEAVVEEKEKEKPDIIVPFVKKELEVDDIINMTVRAARADLKKITDIKLLKYAYEHTRQLANKDTLCQHLRRRIQELELTRR